MAIPTYQDLSTIIKMWRDLEKAKSTFWKNKAKRTKSAHGKNLDDLSVDELLEKLGYTCDPDKPKSLHGLLGAVVRSAVKGEGIPTQFTPKKGKPLSLEDYVGGVKVYFIKGIPAFPTSVLQGLLEQVITPLYKDEEIHTIDEQGKLTEERKNLDEIRDAVRFELKRRTERKRNEKKQENLIGELATTITEINILRNGWPKKIQDQIDKIDVLLSPYWDYLKANGFLGENERRIIETALKSTESKKPKYSPNVIQELERVRYNIQIGSNQKSESQVKAGQGEKITKDEANVRARQLLRETPTWDWTCRKLKKEIGCPLAWIPCLPAWRAYHEKRKELRSNKTIDTVSLSKELEAVLGEGEKDEVLNQLIAEQAGEEREDARQAKLYLNRTKKPDRGRE